MGIPRTYILLNKRTLKKLFNNNNNICLDRQKG